MNTWIMLWNIWRNSYAIRLIYIIDIDIAYIDNKILLIFIKNKDTKLY